MLHIFSVVFTLIFVSTIFIFRSLTVPLSVIYSFISLKLVTRRFDVDDDQKIKNNISDYDEGENIRMLPKHVAVILDGNRRWAQKRGLSTSEGHNAGAKRVVENAKNCFTLGVTTVSLFAFSTENWSRPDDEVSFLMSLFYKHLKSEMPYFLREKVQISVIGNRSKLSESLLFAIQEAEKATNIYQDKHLIIAIDYSGKYDIVEACKIVAEEIRDGSIKVEDINAEKIDNAMMTKCSQFPNPDLLIRTSGEQRISNFFLWQCAYTELYFTPTLWPDFGEAENLEALKWFQMRKRRFGQRI